MPGGGFQEMARVLAHRPYQGDVAQLYLFLLALPADATMQKLNEGVHGRFITMCDPSFLGTIGAERGILHGLTESDDSYRERLLRSLDDLSRAGNPWSVLSQVLGYVLSATPRALTVQSSYTAAGVVDESTWDFFIAGQNVKKAPSTLYDAAGNWDWDSLSPTSGSWGWWRWYLVLSATSPNAWIAKSGTWGSGGTWGSSGYAWGVTSTRLVGLSIRIIVGQFKANWCDWIIITFDDALFLPSSPAGGGINPDGHFGRWSKLVGGVYVRARFSEARYFEGPNT